MTPVDCMRRTFSSQFYSVYMDNEHETKYYWDVGTISIITASVSTEVYLSHWHALIEPLPTYYRRSIIIERVKT